MTISLAINNAITGINAAQAGLGTIAQNVANANTEGYSRKVTNQSAIVIGGVSNGVNLDAATRLANQFLGTQLQNEMSEFNKAAAVDEFYRLTRNLFGAPGSNTSISDFFSDIVSSFETMANNPENAALRFDVVSAATTFADNAATVAKNIQDLRFAVDQEIKASVDRINLFLEKAENLNGEITIATSAGHPLGDLEDKRDLAIQGIAKEIDINTVLRSDGKVIISTRTGVSLLSDRRREVVYTPSSTVTATTSFADIRVFNRDPNGATTGTGDQVVTSGTSPNVTTTLSAGRIVGLLQTRDTELADLSATLDEFIRVTRDQVNAVHNQGTSFPGPPSLTGTRSVGLADVFQGTGTVRIAVTDSAGLLIDPVDIDLSALGATTVGGVVSAINTGLAGNATAAVTNGVLVITADNAANHIAINDSGTAENTTSRGFSHYFGLNDFFTGTNAETLALRADIVTDPGRVSSAFLSKTATATQVALTVGDNRAAQGLAGIGTSLFAFNAVGGLPAMTISLNDYAGSLIGLSATRSAEAENSFKHREVVLENITARHQSETGVNVDEELATLVLFQNAFTMSARVIQIASEMLEVLVNIGA
ncbi:MAG: flagellar hook-associated protein FlgK [Rhodospirillales bacterium]|jgi:flagellar hook-associated protein 1 FlgK|nr:flagellar hook-associated protein FlgK [Rhodospirillales bacterium]